jgi:ribosomal protein L11 methyltransferase
LTVLPGGGPADARVERGNLTVQVDPGGAFGGGEHPTTRLCLAAAVSYVRRGTRVIDVGTGSGILALACARLGAGRVLAIDNDRGALAVARANADANRLGRAVTIRQGDALSGVRWRVDLVLANLSADALWPVFRRARACLAPGGRLVSSGFGTVSLAEVRDLAIAAGLEIVRTPRLEDWCAVHATVARRTSFGFCTKNSK